MQAKWGIQGMAVAPHSLASESALAVLREGGNALEAMVAAAATIAVVYPHMNSIGGDSFWVIHSPGKAMGGIDACGAAAGLASKQHAEWLGLKSDSPVLIIRRVALGIQDEPLEWRVSTLNTNQHEYFSELVV